jgi:hypothetical protein
LSVRLTVGQTAIVEAPIQGSQFVQGIAGSGKTTAAVRRLRHLLESGVPGHEILVLVPQKGLALPYQQELRAARRNAGSSVTVTTFAGLSQSMVELFWPLIRERINPQDEMRQPVFLTLELVQYLMARFVGPEIDANDYFNSVRISRGRLYSQIVDNLNKAAVVGFPPNEISTRLKSASLPDPERHHIYDDAQASADKFRQACVDNSLLDFSRQVTLFVNYLWAMQAPREYLTTRYRHIIYDNCEEDPPAAHYLMREWLPASVSALVIYDDDAGYRKFLGADAIEALTLKPLCDVTVELQDTRVMSGEMLSLHRELRSALTDTIDASGGRRRKGDARAALALPDAAHNRYHTQTLDWTADQVATLIHDDGVRPSEIVVLAPLLSDALRFSVASRLEQRGVETYSLRPSRALHDEPVVRAMLTFAKLANPAWSFDSAHMLRPFDVTQALLLAIDGLDLTRAQLLTETLFRNGRLNRFRDMQEASMRARITEIFGERVDRLSAWLGDSGESEAEPVDVFFSRLFGEVLSQPGYGFHSAIDAGRVVASLIASARGFRLAMGEIMTDIDLREEFVHMVEEGVMADQYLPAAWRKRPEAVLIAPAYTFLVSNQFVDYQFWLNVDDPSWGRRLQQPLTQPYVLSRQWKPGDIWTDEMERSTGQDMLARIISGLLRRCRRRIYFGSSQFDDRGYEQQSALRIAVDYMLSRLNETEPPTGATDDFA